MKRWLILVALLGLVAVSSYGQEVLLKVDIPFEFVAAGTTLPAGTYDVRRIDEGTLELQSAQMKKSVILPVLTRIGTIGGVHTPQLTFDTLDGKYTIESLWTGDADGYLFNVLKEKHTHKTIKVG